MDTKQILSAVAILIGTFVLIIGSVVGIYYFYPELLGFSPKNKSALHSNDSTKVKNDSLISQKKKAKKDEKEENLSYSDLKELAFSLKDSLKSNQETLKIFNDSISGLIKRIVELSSYENKMTDSVKLVKKKMSNILDEMNKFKSDVHIRDSISIVKHDSLSVKNLMTFAKIYNNSAPSEVAKILEKLDGKDAAKILKIMQPKKAGKVLENMKPELAAQILLQGASE